MTTSSVNMAFTSEYVSWNIELDNISQSEDGIVTIFITIHMMNRENTLLEKYQFAKTFNGKPTQEQINDACESIVNESFLKYFGDNYKMIHVSREEYENS